MTSTRANLFLLALGLSLLGLVMIYSATYRDFGAHYLITRTIHLAIGLGIYVVCCRIRYTSWRKLSTYLYFGVLVLLVLVLIPGIGTEVGGARRWLDFGFINFQPAEFAKLTAVVILSVAISRMPKASGVPIKPLLAVGVLFLLVLVEPDFGTSVVIIAGAAGVLWASEVRTRDLLLFGSVGLGALVLVMFLEPYRRDRFMTFLNPWAVSDGAGYQVVQSMIAIKAGDFWGIGAGGGAQGVSIPEVQTDMIFALVGEELGLIGMIVVIVAFGAFTVMGMKISLSAPTVMARCMAAGLTTMISVQALFNMGAAMVVLPLAGITLPFISYGGSSLIVCFAAVGILHRISEDSERASVARPLRRKKPVGSRGDSRRRDGGTRDPRAMRG